MRILFYLMFSISLIASEWIFQGSFGDGLTYDKLFYHKDKNLLAASSNNGNLSFYKISANTLTKIDLIKTNTQNQRASFSSNGDYLYYVKNSNELCVADLKTLTQSLDLTCLNLNYEILDLKVDKASNKMVVLLANKNIKIYDLSLPKSPVDKNVIGLSTTSSLLALNKNILVLATTRGLEFYNLAESTPLIESTFSITQNVVDMEYLDDGSLLVLDLNKGVYKLDISDIKYPVILSFYPIKNGNLLSFDSDLIVVNNGSFGLIFLSKTDLSFVSNYKQYGTIKDLIYLDSQFVVSRWDLGLELYNLSSNDCLGNLAYARNPNNAKWSKFYSVCDVPFGWEISQSTPSDLQAFENIIIRKKDVDNLPTGWHLLGTTQEITDMGVFSSASYVWVYEMGEWRVYSPKETLSSKIESRSYKKFNAIPSGYGFWVYK